MIARRGFLASIAAFIAAPFVPKPTPKPQALLFHPEAFKLVMGPLDDRCVGQFDAIYGVGRTITVKLPERYARLQSPDQVCSTESSK